MFLDGIHGILKGEMAEVIQESTWGEREGEGEGWRLITSTLPRRKLWGDPGSR